MKTKIILAAIGLTLAQFSFAHSEQHAKKPNQQANFIQEEWGIGANKKRSKQNHCYQDDG